MNRTSPRSYRFLLRPRWIAAILIAAAAIVAFVALGFWQLERLAERRTINAKILDRATSEPVDLDGLVAGGSGDVTDLEYLPVVAEGRYLADREIILSARSQAGRSGHNVLTPLVTRAGTTVVVDRGWVPIDVDGPPVVGAEPPDGVVRVVGMLRRSETYGPLGPVDTVPFERIGRIDLPILAERLDLDLIPMYVVLVDQEPAQEGELPIPLPPPQLSEGPHKAYAVQWFLFALVVAVGFPVLLVRTAKGEIRPSSSGRPSTPSSVP